MTVTLAKHLHTLPALAFAAALGFSTPALAGTIDQDQWAQAMSRQLDGSIRDVSAAPLAFNEGRAAIVMGHFDAEGRFERATIERRTGTWMLDREALRAVRALDFAELPEALRGRPVAIPFEILFGDTDAIDRTALREQANQVAYRYNGDRRVALAAYPKK